MKLDELSFSTACKGIRVVQTLRGEVDARNAYSQWNLCDYTGDDALRVLDARLQFCRQLGVDLDHLVMPRQTHSTNVLFIDGDFSEASIETQDTMLEGVDALVTKLPGVCIGVNTADCVPIALAAPDCGIIAIAHAGWRGTVAGIAQKTVEAMCLLGATASNIVATMGASICQECFEVGDEVAREFEKAGFDMATYTAQQKERREKEMKKAEETQRAEEPQAQEEQVPGQIEMELIEKKPQEMTEQVKLMRFQAGQIDKLVLKLDHINDTLNMILRAIRKE